MRDTITFLTSKPLDKPLLLNILKNSKISKDNDKNILGIIIHDFSSDNFTLINSQENLFLNLHSHEVWAPYLIFRYKFKFGLLYLVPKSVISNHCVDLSLLLYQYHLILEDNKQFLYYLFS